MMKNKLRYFMVLTALAMCFGTFSVTAYAQSNEPQEETAPVEETTEPEETATPNPFTPNGTGTVLDNAGIRAFERQGQTRKANDHRNRERGHGNVHQ